MIASPVFLVRAGVRRRAARRLALAAAWAACALAAVASPAVAQISSEQEREWNQPVPPFRIAGNVYYVGAHEVAAYLIATPEGHVILDSGFEETVPLILAGVEALGFRPADVRWILSSHAHFDHNGGLASLRERTGAKIAMSARDAELAARGGQGDPNFGDRFAYRAFTPDRTIDNGDVVELGGTRLAAHLTPGHTRGCTTWTLRVEERGEPLDVLFLCSLTAPGYRLVGNAGHPEIVEDYRASFAHLATLDVDVFLANHGSFFDLHGKRERLCANPQENPFVDPEGWRRHLATQREAFEKKLDEQTSAPSP
jgi:metallo-beta-lactamase class B